MVMLADREVRTREVTEWKGTHLLHFQMSSCSQKTRIFLGLKGVEWISHPVDIPRGANHTEWYLGINPRGLVPVLVVDGVVHIESNDIMTYIDEHYPGPKLIPEEQGDEIAALLKAEDDLHMDLRALTMRFVFPSFLAKKQPAALEAFKSMGSSTVGGEADPQKALELQFWQDFAKQGITDEQTRVSARRFREALDGFDQRLSDAPYLLGSNISLVDIAWFIYANRLLAAGYPLHRLHPKVGQWYDRLLERPEFRNETAGPAIINAVTGALHLYQKATGRTLEQVAGL